MRLENINATCCASNLSKIASVVPGEREQLFPQGNLRYSCRVYFEAPTSENREQQTQENSETAQHHSVYCPNCSSKLTSHRCKLICTGCGYYLSCADYY
jgi:hypothetical protein